MSQLKTVLSNKPLTIAITAWFIAQFFKFTITAVKKRKFDFTLLVSTGGFPSSHTAIVGALATSIGLNFGFGSPFFAISVVMASVVISDARGIRRAAGKQAQILNKIIDDLYQKRELKIERLKELLGHTPFEVFSGAILGIFIALLLN
jgi:hypothetical protein